MSDLITSGGAFGYDTYVDQTWHVDVPFRNVHASADVVAGDAVSIAAGGVLPATTAIGEGLVVGIAVDTIPAGEIGLVTVKGAATARTAAAVAAGAAVNRSGSAAGAVASGATIALGVAVTAGANDQVNIWIY